VSRWNGTVTLLAPASKYQDEAGAWHEGERVPREIYCNEMTMSLVAMAQLRSADVRASSTTQTLDMGLRNEHMIQVRTIDYNGEDEVVFNGEEYEVLYLSGSGEFRTLTIGQRIGNTKTESSSEEPADEPSEGGQGG